MGNKLQHGHLDADDGGVLSASIGIIPSGGILPYGGSSAPSGYLLCDGSAVSRTTYATLFGVIGTAFGSGDGSTTFNVPDLRGRSPLGSGTGTGLTARTIGQTGGEENHALTSAENGSHTHTATVTDPGHQHTYQRDYTQGSGPITVGWVQAAGAYSSQVDSNTTGISVTNANSGSGTGHNTMHPFTVTNFIIKT